MIEGEKKGQEQAARKTEKQRGGVDGGLALFFRSLSLALLSARRLRRST